MPKKRNKKPKRRVSFEMDEELYVKIMSIAFYKGRKGEKSESGYPVSVTSLLNEAAMNIPAKYEDTLKHIDDLIEQGIPIPMVYSGKY